MHEKKAAATALHMLAMERVHQTENEEYDHEQDDNYHESQLARAAACYALPESRRTYTHAVSSDDRGVPINWPWLPSYWKPTPDNRLRELQKAGGLILAEMERILRAQP